MEKRIRIICALLGVLFIGSEITFGQTNYFWRSENTQNSWQNGSAWWNGSAETSFNFGVQIWDNNAELSQVNNADVGTHKFEYRAGASSVHTFTGNKINFFDNSGTDPSINNNSSATHIINNNIVGDPDSGDPFSINIGSAGGLTFGGTIDNNGTDVYIAGSTGSSATVTLNGVVSGGGKLIKQNSNTTLVLAASNSYTGETTIQAGTVTVTGTLGTGDVRIANGGNLDLDASSTVSSVAEAGTGNGGTIDIASGATLTINGTDKGTVFQNSITGLGNLVINGSGTTVISLYGTQSYTGTTTISGGGLTTSADMSSSGITVQTGGTLTVSDDLSVNDLEIQAGGTLNIEAGDTLTIRSGSSLLNNGTINLNGTGVIQYERQITGTEGWRMLSTPTSNNTYDDLLGDLWTQGIGSGADVTNGTASVQLYNTTTDNFVAATDLGATMSAGIGFITYVYSDDDYTNSGADAGFPKTLFLDGTENAAPVAAVLNDGANAFTLLGNPFASTIDWDELSPTDITGTVYVYDHSYSTINGGGDDVANGGASGGGYRTWNGTAGSLTGGLITPFQGFWVQNSAIVTLPALAFVDGAKSSGGTFFKEASNKASFRLFAQMDNYGNDAFFSFTNEGKITKDNFDGLELAPIDHADYVSLSTLVGNEELDINNLPLDLTEKVEVPLMLNSYEKTAEGYKLKGGEVTLSWTDFSNIPASWTITLKDYANERSIDLRAQNSYTFDVKGSENTVKSKTVFSVLSPISATREKSTKSSDMSIVIIPSTAVSNEPISKPSKFELDQNYPNPFNPTTTITYSVGQSGPVNITVYNVMGRKVAELVNATKNAGTDYKVSWNATGQASGIYYYRLTAPGQVLTRQMTLIK